MNSNSLIGEALIMYPQTQSLEANPSRASDTCSYAMGFCAVAMSIYVPRFPNRVRAFPEQRELRIPQSVSVECGGQRPNGWRRPATNNFFAGTASTLMKAKKLYSAHDGHTENSPL